METADARGVLSAITASLDMLLRSEGYTRSKLRWSRKLPDVLQMIYLEKNRFGAIYHVGAGLHVPALSAEVEPPPHRLHVGFTSHEYVVKQMQARWGTARNFDDPRSMSLEERCRWFTCYVSEYVLPLLPRQMDRQDVRRILTEPQLRVRYRIGPVLLDPEAL